MAQYTLDCQGGYTSTSELRHIDQVTMGLHAPMLDYIEIRYLLYKRHEVRIFLTGFPSDKPLYYKVGGINYHKSDYRTIK